MATLHHYRRRVDCPVELSARRHLRCRTFVLSRGTRSAVTVAAFADTEQAQLLGNTFPQQQQACLPEHIRQRLPSAQAVVLDLGRYVAHDDASLAAAFERIRIWEPQQVLAQYILDLCHAAVVRQAATKRQCVEARRQVDGSTSMLELRSGTGVCSLFASHALEGIAGGSAGLVVAAESCPAAQSVLQLNCGLNQRQNLLACRMEEVASGGEVLKWSSATPQRRRQQQFDVVMAVVNADDPLCAAADNDHNADGKVTPGPDSGCSITRSAEQQRWRSLWVTIDRYLRRASGSFCALSCTQPVELLRRGLGGEVVVSDSTGAFPDNP